MRIGFTGAGATGKSSLLSLCEKDSFFKDYGFHGSIARKVFTQRGFLSERDQSAHSPQDNLGLQKAIIDEKIIQQNSILVDGTSIISDRILLDHFAYLVTRNSNLINNKYFKLILFETIANCFKYDIIFVFEPFNTPPDPDGFREVNQTVAYCVNAVIQSHINDMVERCLWGDDACDDIPTIITIPSSMSIDKRLTFIKDSINNHAL